MDTLKYGLMAKAIKFMCFPPALKILPRFLSGVDCRVYKKAVQREFKAMLLRTPNLGGSSLEPNLYLAAFVFSLYKADQEHITPAIVDAMTDAVFESDFIVRAHKNKKCTLFTDKVQDKKVRESAASWKSSYALDWKFDYFKGIDEFYTTYYECGICKLGEREGCSAFVPCLCKMDERNYRNEGGQRHRTKTLANGDDCCDFHVTRIVK